MGPALHTLSEADVLERLLVSKVDLATLHDEGQTSVDALSSCLL